MPYCKECNKKKNKKWRDANIEQARASCIRSDTLENKRRRGKKYRESQAFANWKENNRDLLNSYSKDRYSNKTHKINKEEWEECKEFFNHTCAYCGISETEAKEKYGQYLHKEHVIHDGTNGIDNCIPSCKICNSSKRTNEMLSWYSRQSFYSSERLEKIIEWLDKFS